MIGERERERGKVKSTGIIFYFIDKYLRKAENRLA
jgi:hypothetical protein